MARQLTLEIAVEKTRAQQELRELEQGLKNLEQSALKSGQATDKQKDAYDNLGKRAADARAKIKGYTDEVKQSTTEQDKATKSSGLLTTSIMKYVAAGAIIAAVKHTAEWADRLEELSKSTGISITMLQKLDQVTKLNGTSVEVLSKAFGSMQDRVAGGDKSAVRAFEKLGISFGAFQKMRPDDQMTNLAIAVMKIDDPMHRANVVTDLFGRTGIQLIPTLEKIAGGMDDITVATEGQIKAVGNMADMWEKAKTAGGLILTDALTPIAYALGVLDTLLGKVNLSVTSVLTPFGMWKTAMAELDRILQGLNADLEKYLGLSFRAGANPTAPAPPGLFDGPGGPAALDPAEILRIETEVNAQIASQIRLRGDNRGKVAETTTALREQLSVMDMQAQRMSDISTFFGYKPKNFAWEDMPAPPAPGMPGANGPNNYQQILQPYFGMNAPGYYGPGGYGSPQSRLGRWGQGLAGQQQAWAQANFGSMEGWTNSAMGWAQGADEIVNTGETSVLRATNVRGRGKRALGGAIAGAQEGAQYGGVYGAMGGAVVGLIIGLVRNPAFEKVFDNAGKRFGVTISEELSRSIADLAKSDFKGNLQAAEVRSLGSVLGETGGITAENVEKMTLRLRDAFQMFGTGKFDKKQLTATLDESFGYFAEYYNKIGGLADASFTHVIRMARESGVESAEVQKYISQQVDTAAAGLETYLMNATVKSQSAASGMAAAMVLLFDETRKGPEGLRGAIDKLAPMVLTLQEQMTAAGFTGTEAFDGMLSYIKAFEVEGVAAATEAVDGLNATLEGLHNSTLLNAESFSGLSRAMTDEIEVARQALIAQGIDGDNALRLNAAGLQTVWELQKQFGWAVDESTQAMLDQAEAQGLIGAAFMDTNEKMLEAMNRMADTLDRIANHMGAVGDAAEATGEQIDDAFRPRTVPVDFEFPDEGPRGPNGNPNGYERGGVVRGRQMGYFSAGFVPRGTDTVPAMLTPGEGVLSRRGVRALGALNEGGTVGGGNVFHINITANDESGGRAAAEAFIESMRQRGVKLAAVS
jgi:uncharacterized protein YukE